MSLVRGLVLGLSARRYRSKEGRKKNFFKKLCHIFVACSWNEMRGRAGEARSVVDHLELTTGASDANQISRCNRNGNRLVLRAI